MCKRSLTWNVRRNAPFLINSYTGSAHKVHVQRPVTAHRAGARNANKKKTDSALVDDGTRWDEMSSCWCLDIMRRAQYQRAWLKRALVVHSSTLRCCYALRLTHPARPSLVLLRVFLFWIRGTSGLNLAMWDWVFSGGATAAVCKRSLTWNVRRNAPFLINSYTGSANKVHVQRPVTAHRAGARNANKKKTDSALVDDGTRWDEMSSCLFCLQVVSFFFFFFEKFQKFKKFHKIKKYGSRTSHWP